MKLNLWKPPPSRRCTSNDTTSLFPLSPFNEQHYKPSHITLFPYNLNNWNHLYLTFVSSPPPCIIHFAPSTMFHSSSSCVLFHPVDCLEFGDFMVHDFKLCILFRFVCYVYVYCLVDFKLCIFSHVLFIAFVWQIEVSGWDGWGSDLPTPLTLVWSLHTLNFIFVFYFYSFCWSFFPFMLFGTMLWQIDVYGWVGWGSSPPTSLTWVWPLPATFLFFCGFYTCFLTFFLTFYLDQITCNFMGLLAFHLKPISPFYLHPLVFTLFFILFF